MKKWKVQNILLILLLLISNTFYLNGQSEEEGYEHQILISFTNTGVNSFGEDASGCLVLDGISELNTEIWCIGDTVTYGGDTIIGLDNIIEYLESFVGIVEYAEPNYPIYLFEDPNDTYYPKLWGMPKIDAPEAWEVSEGSEDVVVAVFDTGIDWSHPDLINNIWQNLGEDSDGDGTVLEWDESQNRWIFDPGDENNFDDDGNGYADDFVGWDFIENDNTVDDKCFGHGTHVAGTVGAVGNNNEGVIGVCPNVQLMAVKIFSTAIGCQGDIAAASKGLYYAVSMGADISNHSYGSANSSITHRQAILDAEANNHLFIAAAGNDTANVDLEPKYPAAYDIPNVISVAATDENDLITTFSNYGKLNVDLAAPGIRIYSTLPTADYILHPDGNFGYYNGTSMACPHVAGAAALIKASCGVVDYQVIKNAILNSVDEVPNLEDKCVTGGRLNIFNALNQCESVCLESDSLTLVAFNSLMGGNAWTKKWNLDKPVNTWEGVTLSENQCQVIGIDLTNNNLVGTIPSELSQLFSLESLILSDNNLQDAIPDIFIEMSKLETLFLDKNNLSGCYPDVCNVLNTNFENNMGLPDGGSMNSYEAFCTNNDLQFGLPCDDGKSGTINDIINEDCTCAGTAVENCSKLDSLFLVAIYNATSGDNWINSWNFSEPISKWHGVTLNTESCNVSELDLSDNNLTGTLPFEVGYLTKLTKLYLQNNSLEGCYPISICNLNLSDVDFSGNDGLPYHGSNEGFVDFCSGSTNFMCLNECIIPDSLALVAFYNSTNGPNWNNKWVLTEPVNTWYGITLSEDGCNVVCLDLDGNANCQSTNATGNNLEGTLPVELFELSSLESLFLSHNKIKNAIPSELGLLVNLKHLDLGYNEISGQIPTTISNLAVLESIKLLANELIGNIPEGIGELTNLTELILGLNEITGEIPDEIGSLLSLEKLYLNSNELTGCYPQSLCEVNLKEYLFSGNSGLPDGGSSQGFKDFCSGLVPCENTNECDPLVLDLGPDKDIECGISIKLSTNSPDAESTIWKYEGEVIANNLETIFAELPGIYTVIVTNSCDEEFSDSIEVGEITGCVWPGDANNDGIVNYLDWVPINNDHERFSEGYKRENASLDWVGQPCKDWIRKSDYGINDKYSDTNGDGIVDGDDYQAIWLHYDKTHGERVLPKIALSTGFMVTQEIVTTLSNNDKSVVNLIIKQEDINAQGIGCRIDLGADKVKSAYFVYNSDLFGEDVKTFDYFNETNNSLDIAISKVKENRFLKGAGIIGRVIIEEKEIGSFKPENINIDEIVLVDQKEESFYLGSGSGFTLFSSSEKVDVDYISLKAGWNLLSLDIIPYDLSLKSVFANLKTNNLEQVVAYDNGAFVFDPNIDDVFNTMDEYTPGLGYWVKVKEDDVLALAGFVPEEIFPGPLNMGWNLVGFYPEVTHSAETYFADLIADQNLVYATTYREEELVYDPLKEADNSLDVLENGDGMWLKMDRAINGGSNEIDNSTNIFEFIYGTSNLPKGEEIIIQDSNGQSIGSFTVLDDGKLMTNVVYGDDPRTIDLIEGVVIDSPISFSWENQVLEDAHVFKGDMHLDQIDLKFSILEEGVNLDVNLFPNPVINEVTFNVNFIESTEEVLVAIYDFSGKVIFTFKEEMEGASIADFKYDLSDLPVGKYLYKVSSKDFSHSDNFIKLD